MSTSTLRRTTLVVFLAAVLTTSWASAAGPRAPRAAKAQAPTAAGLLDRTVYFLVSLWAELGCDIDPSGRCTASASQPAQPTVDLGCNIDLNGHCTTRAPQTAQPQTDTGCNIDPGGRCIH